ncbi:restriction endonuclease subunit S [Domibacillus tundrae]|uniref:restriction endonuclease subunit S n=1 Tax=Domibacillus tundrae TaxID=1587527 RepID=UPI000617BFE3|nr:restriction endonuclease subunit S [Domibacillus tundrae]
MAEKDKKPEIRFTGFTDAWAQLKLGDLSESFEYGLNAAATDFDGVNKYIRITDIDDESRKFLEKNLTSPNIDLSNADNYKLKNGDILFARTGASVGKTYIYNVSDGLVYYAGFLIRARIKREYDREFVFQNTLSNGYKKYISITSQRSGQPGVNAQEFAEYKINVPKYDEQVKIGAFLKEMDNLITLQQRKHDKLVLIKKSMLEKMFPKDGADVPEIRFAEFTDSWEKWKVGDVLKQKQRPIKMEDNKEYQLVTVKRRNEGIVSRGYLKGKDILVKNYFEIRSGDYLISKRQVIHGANGIVPENLDKSIVSNEYLVAIGNKNITTEYWTLISKRPNMYKQFFLSSYGVDIEKLVFDVEDWKKRTIILPLLPEQEKITLFFHRLDHLITLHQRKLEKLKNIKKSMLEKMFV